MMKKIEYKVAIRKDNWKDRSTMICENCMYYLEHRCRRRAPQGNEGWTAVFRTDWCGQHKLSKETMEKWEA